jgi:hypothetical protein
MDERHVLSDLFFDLIVTEVNLFEESLSDINESLLGPVLEPIDGGGIDESGEHTSPDTESGTNRGEAKSDVEILSSLILEVLKDSIHVVSNTLTLSLSSEFTKDGIKLLCGEQLWDPTRGQKIVEVHKELIFWNLTISDDEQKLLSSNTSLLIHVLDIGLKVVLVVGIVDLDSHDIISQDEGGKFSKRLLTGTSDTNKKGVTTR